MKSKYVDPEAQQAVTGSLFAYNDNIFVFVDRGPDYQLHQNGRYFIEARKVQTELADTPNKYYFRLQPFPVLKEESNHLILKPFNSLDLSSFLFDVG